MRNLIVILFLVISFQQFVLAQDNFSSHPSENVRLNDIVADENGVVYILDKLTMIVFRYDSKKGEYTLPISLESNYEKIVYSKAHKRIYLASSSCSFAYIDLPGFQKEVKLQLSEFPCKNNSNQINIVAVDNHLFVNNWDAFYVYDKNVASVSKIEWSHNRGDHYVLGHNTLFFATRASPSEINKQEISGGILSNERLPYRHWDQHRDDPGTPLAANKNFVVTSTGGIYDAVTLDRRGKLPFGILSGLFLEKLKLLTVSNQNGLALKVWNAFRESDSFSIQGESGVIVGEGINAILVYKNKIGLNFAVIDDVLTGKISL